MYGSEVAAAGVDTNAKNASSSSSDKTADMTAATSQSEESAAPPARAGPVSFEMLEQMMNGIDRDSYTEKGRSSASMTSSSIWSSSSGVSGSSDTDSYEFSSFNSDSEEDDSSYDSSFSDDEPASDDDDDNNSPKAAAKKTKEKTYPQPPPMMEGLGALDANGVPLMFANLKKDLEQVGRTIISSNVGNIIAERAHTLASINWLSSHVPNAVLDELGHEIRRQLDEEKNAKSVKGDQEQTNLPIVEGDEMSHVSELSDALNDMEYSHENAGDVAEVAGSAPMSYGDLAQYGQARTNEYLPDVADETPPIVSPEYDTMAMNIVDDYETDIPRAGPRASATSLFSKSAEDQDPELAALRQNMFVDDGNDEGYNGESMLDDESIEMALKSPTDKKSNPKRLKLFGRRRSTRDRSDTMSSEGLPQNVKSPNGKNGVRGLFNRLVRRRNSGLESLESLQRGSARTLVSQETRSESESSSSDDTHSHILLDDFVENGEGMRLPSAASYHCALLFVDISGFTKLSQRLDPESLSKAINSYFQLIVDEVIEGKGDLLKFAGDAVFIEWKATEKIDLEHCVEAAAKCAAKIVLRCANFAVLANGANGGSSCAVQSQAEKISQLNVHCGIGAGQMVGIHVGDQRLRREYLLLGQPIQQATVATDCAAMGEVAVSPEALSLLSRICVVDKDAVRTGKNSPSIIAARERMNFAPKVRLGVHQPKIINELSRGVTHLVEGLEVEALKEYRRKMSLYVHPVVVDNDVAGEDFKGTRAKRTAQERHREEAELRNVYTMFVSPLVDVNITNSEKANKKMYNRLNDIMNLTSREIDRYCGHLRQFIVDDKGLVIIITFGLRGTTVPDMVAQRALPATIAIHNALFAELGVQSRIGATVGETYCGVVGGVKRHEYAVLGPSVNLAARLMCSKTNPGILVDNRVRMMANRSYGFNALPPVVAKGYRDPVPIFEPLSPLERTWGRILPNFVGRKAEITMVMEMARDLVLYENQAKIVLVRGESGMGKTTAVTHCIEHVRKLLEANKHRVLVTKNVSKESDGLVPFGAFRSIFRQVLASVRLQGDDMSFKSGGSVYSALQHSIGWESLSGRSMSQASLLSSGKAADVLAYVCRDLNIQSSVVNHAIHHLLGVSNASARNSNGPIPTPLAMISIVAKLFKRCTQDVKLVVVAFDDLQNADELSWRVIREIFSICDNCLVLGTINEDASTVPRVEPEFWDNISSEHPSRVAMMDLQCLTQDDIASMIMKTLGLHREEVNQDFLDGIVIQSGGMPHFVNEILEYMKRHITANAEFEISDITYESFGDLVLQRLDSFDLTTRNVLNVGAVLGQSFSLEEIMAVQIKTSDATEFAVRNVTTKSFDTAVEEGILQKVTDTGDGGDTQSEQVMYCFVHAVWRTALLNLMLEGRQRDLHHVIAETYEAQKKPIDDYIFQTKLFSHWKASSNFPKSAELALAVGQHFEDKLGLPAQSIRLYNESLDMLRDVTSTGGVAGFSKKTLMAANANELSYIIKIQVSLGRAYAMAQHMTDSVNSYQDALKILQAAKAAAELPDRSILFPVFTGLSLALKHGHIVQDPECRYEQAMVRRYVQETKHFGDPIYLIHSISLQTDMYARLGDIERALECQQALAAAYNVEEHSVRLFNEFGSDLGAQSYSNSSLWLLQLDRQEDALGVCWFVVEDLMPRMEQRNVHAAFCTIYPVLWVLKESGFALEAREYFEDHVCLAYEKHFGEGRSTFFLPLYDPIIMLFDLAGKADVEPEMVQEYLDWALDPDNLAFGTLLNAKTGELGRTADSISGEICYLLAQHVDNEEDMKQLLKNAITVVQEDVLFSRQANLPLAETCSANLLINLLSFGSEGAGAEDGMDDDVDL